MNRRHSSPALLALLIVIGFASCAKKEPTTSETNVSTPAETQTPATPPPTIEAARTFLESSEAFGDYQFTLASVSLPMKRSRLNDVTRPTVDDLTRAGWLRDRGDEIALSEKAEKDKRFLVRPNGFLDIVPLAKKELMTVDAVGNDAPGSPTIDFKWRWIPNDVAQSFHGDLAARFSTTYHARATLFFTQDGWDVLRIEKIGEPAADVPK